MLYNKANSEHIRKRNQGYTKKQVINFTTLSKNRYT